MKLIKGVDCSFLLYHEMDAVYKTLWPVESEYRLAQTLFNYFDLIRHEFIREKSILLSTAHF